MRQDRHFLIHRWKLRSSSICFLNVFGLPSFKIMLHSYLFSVLVYGVHVQFREDIGNKYLLFFHFLCTNCRKTTCLFKCHFDKAYKLPVAL